MHPFLPAAAIATFLNDDRAFQAAVEDRFTTLDADGDGLISFIEMARELMGLRTLDACFDTERVGLSHPDLVELHRDIFSGVDRDGRRAVDLAEFGEEMMEMMVAVVDMVGVSKKNCFLYSKL